MAFETSMLPELTPSELELVAGGDDEDEEHHDEDNGDHGGDHHEGDHHEGDHHEGDHHDHHEGGGDHRGH